MAIHRTTVDKRLRHTSKLPSAKLQIHQKRFLKKQKDLVVNRELKKHFIVTECLQL
ncbi:hypothetical protein ES705_10320 [subsurface metagenome]